ncbi:MAG: M1 family metallopeptidase [Saprospiraceae bacterium]
MMRKLAVFALALLSCVWLTAQENVTRDPFRQLDTELPTPNGYRTASGAPGPQYWQQQADYAINVELDDDNQRISGDEVITYHNNSPDALEYLWLQLDQNVRAKTSDTYKISPSQLSDRMSTSQLDRMEPDFDGGFKIEYVRDNMDKPLPYTINNTMMRVDIPMPLKPGETYSFKVKWWYNINNTREIGGRSGFEHFTDGNNVYCIAQFYPRMCVYNDVTGWQNKQFLGRGEFTLTFGNFKVNITVPADHLIGATGTLQNAKSVLSKEQINRWDQAHREFEQPVMISNLDEALEKEKSKSGQKKTWTFTADNVRDFAFATSRKFIWDAMGVKMSDGRVVMAQSMYVREGYCLWSKFSTKAVAHTIKWYSHYTFDYPYPTAWSVDGSMGMEYPMIAFNNGRCEDDGTYSERAKYGHIGVIIHEIGHNWFPMIVNSDERQWTWMDEGINTFVQYLTEVQWEKNYPARRGPANMITDYMASDKKYLTPIMSNSESLYNFGSNAYAKPATGLNILRETIMGRELFDFAFKTYANRWKFKSPTPADFFRTMEDASSVDLDWFWRGWFYSTDHCDMAIKSVRKGNVNPSDPMLASQNAQQAEANRPKNISEIRNQETIKQYYADIDTTIRDFYSTYDPNEVTNLDMDAYQRKTSGMSDDEKELMNSKDNFYEVTFQKIGGLIMPVIIQIEYTDGSSEVLRYPAEIWLKQPDNEVSKVIRTEKEIAKITLDPFLETADTDTSNNNYPPQAPETRFEVFKRQFPQGENPMQRAKRAKVIKP